MPQTQTRPRSLHQPPIISILWLRWYSFYNCYCFHCHCYINAKLQGQAFTSCTEFVEHRRRGGMNWSLLRRALGWDSGVLTRSICCRCDYYRCCCSCFAATVAVETMGPVLCYYYSTINIYKFMRLLLRWLLVVVFVV